MKCVTVLIIMGIALHGTGAQNYCQTCADHTMCKYSGIGATCAPLLGSGLSAADKMAVVDAHNVKRSRVAQGLETLGSPGPQPAAANMRKMAWDNELAMVAQRWANQCTFGHDSCRRVSRFSVGQNVYMSMSSSGSSSAADWQGAVDAWYNEVKLFNRSSIAPFWFTSSTGHYTQAVWADSGALGCGFAYYKTAQDTWFKKLYVCNYGPAGNVIRGSMYVTGAACSRCPSGTRCDSLYRGLCSA